MACKTSCKLCPHLVLSQSVTFANDTLHTTWRLSFNQFLDIQRFKFC